MEHSVSSEAAVSLTRRQQWHALHEHAGLLGSRHLRALFAVDPACGARRHAEVAGLYPDYSKQRIPGKTLRLLREPRG